MHRFPGRAILIMGAAGWLISCSGANSKADGSGLGTGGRLLGGILPRFASGFALRLRLAGRSLLLRFTYRPVLDRVRGAAHFDVPEERARSIAGQLAAQMPGYLVPRLAREIYGAPAKVTLPPSFAG